MSGSGRKWNLIPPLHNSSQVHSNWRLCGTCSYARTELSGPDKIWSHIRLYLFSSGRAQRTSRQCLQGGLQSISIVIIIIIIIINHPLGFLPPYIMLPKRHEAPIMPTPNPKPKPSNEVAATVLHPPPTANRQPLDLASPTPGPCAPLRSTKQVLPVCVSARERSIANPKK